MTETVIHKAWCDGYQRAVDAMRSWAEEFAHDDTKAAVLTAAAMIETAKPPETMPPPCDELPTWCTTSSAKELRAMAASEHPWAEVPLLFTRGVYWSDLIAAAERREREP